jgi:hypothetical protein
VRHLGTTLCLLRVSAAGGTPSPVTTLDTARQETLHGYPVFLPDGNHFLYLRRSSIADKTGIYVGTLDAKLQSTKQLLFADSNLAYVRAVRADTANRHGSSDTPFAHLTQSIF